MTNISYVFIILNGSNSFSVSNVAHFRTERQEMQSSLHLLSTEFEASECHIYTALANWQSQPRDLNLGSKGTKTKGTLLLNRKSSNLTTSKRLSRLPTSDSQEQSEMYTVRLSQWGRNYSFGVSTCLPMTTSTAYSTGDFS